MARHLLLNGDILPSDEPCFCGTNIGLINHDAFTVQVRGNSGFVYDSERYFDSILEKAHRYGYDINNLFTHRFFTNDLRLLLQKNRIYKEFVATITLFRNSTLSKSFSVLVNVDSIDYEFYKLNNNGIFTSIFNVSNDLIFLPHSCFPAEYYCNHIIKEKDIDDIIFTTSNEKLLCSLHSDIFFISDEVLILNTSSSENCVNNTFSMRIANLAKEKLKIKVASKQLTIDELKCVDSIFLADPVRGIRWVVGIDKKRFRSNEIIRDLAFELEYFFKKQIEILKGQ